MRIVKNQNKISYKIYKLSQIFDINHGRPQKDVLDDNGLYFIYGSAGNIMGRANKFNNRGNSFIIGRKGTINKPLFIKEPYWSVDTAFNTSNFKICPIFCFYLLKRIDLLKYNEGGAIPSLRKSTIKNIKFNIPEDHYYIKKISKLLSEKEQHIEKIKTLISKLEKRNEYYAEKLLSGKLRVRENEKGEMEFYQNTEWKEVKLNGKLQKIPKEWLIENIGGKLIKLINSGIDKFEGEKRYFATGEVGFLNELKKETEKITFENRTSRANMQPIKNSIWFAKMKNTNKNIYFDYEPVDIVLSTGFCGVTYTENINGIYLMESLLNKNFVNYKNNLCYGSTQEAINNKSLKKIGFLIPLKSEQDMIANILIKRRKEKEILENLLEKETKEFEWLSEKLLSGEYIVED